MNRSEILEHFLLGYDREIQTYGQGRSTSIQPLLADAKKRYEKCEQSDLLHSLYNLHPTHAELSKVVNVGNGFRAVTFDREAALGPWEDFFMVGSFKIKTLPPGTARFDELSDKIALEQSAITANDGRGPEIVTTPQSVTTGGEASMEGIRSNWEFIGPLGTGGQSEVSLVRGPERIKVRTKDIEKIHSFSPWGTSTAEMRPRLTGEFADAVADYARSDRASELGAMKAFKLREAGLAGEEQAVNRLRQEIEVLRAGRIGLPKLLDYNLAERWMVTEYFPARSLEYNFAKYKGNALLALKAFLSLVRTVETLHADEIIHRDIKPANVFVREDDELVLGDFGLVFLPDQPNRLTRTNESVGPHDYMPPWAIEVYGRLADIGSTFDIYMLGKVLWCMVSGRLQLHREDFERPNFDLTKQFKDEPAMYMINEILKKCVVREEVDCLKSATDLALIVSTYVHILEQGGQLLRSDVPRPCRVCGHGQYKNDRYPATSPPIPKDKPVGLRFLVGSSEWATISVFPYVCDYCGHVEFFLTR